TSSRLTLTAVIFLIVFRCLVFNGVTVMIFFPLTFVLPFLPDLYFSIQCCRSRYGDEFVSSVSKRAPIGAHSNRREREGKSITSRNIFSIAVGAVFAPMT